MGTETVRPPPWFWAISVLGLAWNLLGVGAFVNEVFFLDPVTLDELQRDFYQGRPTWCAHYSRGRGWLR